MHLDGFNNKSMDTFGDSIDQYDVYEKLGRGGFAVVYRAICRNTGVEVAIKMIDKGQIKAANMSGRVNQEVEIHFRLKHPSILQLFTYFEDDSFVYLVLEVCCNGELNSYLNKHSRIMSDMEAATITKQIVEGLLYLHSHRIIHRDITLANILLTKDMHIKIADFGLAIQLQQPDQKQMTMCGTPNYISPEVATRGSHGLETDVWGLGIMLYICLVGKPPFEAEAGLKSTLTRVVMSDIKFPAHVSVEARDLIKALLQKNPKNRINLKNILGHTFILKSQSGSVSEPLKRSMSYDSGVAAGSCMISQPCNSYSQGVFPPVINHGSLHNCRPTPPTSRCLSCATEDNCVAISHVSQEYPRRSGHVCPSQEVFPSMNHRAVDYPERSHPSLMPHRFLPVDNSYSQNTQPHSASAVQPLKKHSGISSENNSRYSWRKTKQCSHTDICGCVITTNNCYSSAPKFDDNRSRTKPVSERSVGSEFKRKTEITPPSTKKIPVSPASAKRLYPVRQKGKSVICAILQTGEICLEFTRKIHGHERVWDVMRISSDGMRIIMYHPNKGEGVNISESPPPIPSAGADAIYNYENMPAKYWRQYCYAHKFVNIVKRRTPKLKFYSPLAKFSLMENEPPDFQANFYEGASISKSESTITLTASGKSWTFEIFHIPVFPSDVQSLWDHFRECLEFCETLHQFMNKSEFSNEVFPIFFGKRPQSKNARQQWQSKPRQFISSKCSLMKPSYQVQLQDGVAFEEISKYRYKL